MFESLQGTADRYGAPTEQYWPLGITLPKRPNPQDFSSKRTYANKIRKALRIVGIDLCISNNGAKHHTDKFKAMKCKDSPQLVVRRGQVFYLRLRLDRDFSSQADGLSFFLVPAGCENDECKITKEINIVVPAVESVTSGDSHFKWYACVVDSEEKEMLIKVHPAANCPVGEWQMQVDTKLQVEPDGETYTVEKPIIILFNPWCPNDQVYMEDDDLRQEYVLDETGMICRGSYNNVQSTPWYYGQYERDILQCAIALCTEVTMHNRNDPVRICRCLCAALNSTEGKGVLVAKWDGKYEAAQTRPEAWSGSVKILTKYYKTRQPVKYGQCWVFAGVYTTACRALGIPCRPVTVYNCAHGADCSVLVDSYLDENSKWMPADLGVIWQHEVWNEVWMTRWDLQKPNQLIQNKGAYDGWNVIYCMHKVWSCSDVPQCCGPVSVKAIKDSNMNLTWDTLNAYAEVNADILYWKIISDNKQLKMISRDTSWVGRKVVTKAIGSYKHRDITLNYKHHEGGVEERNIMEKNLRWIENKISRFYMNPDFKKIEFKISLRGEPPMVGSPIEFMLDIHSHSVDTYEAEVTMVIHLENYTSTETVPIKTDQFKVQIEGKEVILRLFRVTYDDYKDCKLKEEDNFRIGCHVYIQEVDFDFFEQDILKMRKPKLNFTVDTSHHPTSSTHRVSLFQEYFEREHKLTSKYSEEFKKTGKENLGIFKQSMGPFNVNVDEEIQIQASFTNPLPVTLTNGIFQFEGPDKLQKLSLDRDVPPGGDAVGKFQWKVKTPGKYEICGTFISNELKEVNGMCHIKIT